MNIEKSCGVILYRNCLKEIEFLLVKSKENGHWGFPKGHMEKDETEEQTAIREVFEETGLSVILLDGFRRKIEYQLTENKYKEVIFFVGVPLKGVVSIQYEEIEELKWFKYKEINHVLTFKNSQRTLMEAKEFIINNLVNK